MDELFSYDHPSPQKAPPIKLLDFVQMIVEAHSYKFFLMTYNCQHFQAAVVARMMGFLAAKADDRLLIQPDHADTDTGKTFHVELNLKRKE